MMYLIPRPQKYSRKEGCCIISYDSKIAIDTSCGTRAYEFALLLQRDMELYAGFAAAITRGISKKTAVTLAIRGGLRPDGYELTVDERGILLTGGADTGLFYGVQTLRQIIRQEGACIPRLVISDYPSIPNRGLYYDVTRGRIPTLSYLKQLADKMAFYKLNQLQLYVEHSFLFENLSEVWRDDTPLTPQDILELDAYCREREIELVPSLSCFGHLYKVLRTKTCGNLCERPDLLERPFGFVDRMEHHTLDVSNPESLAFVKRLIDEFLPLFTSGYFNIGGDETFDLGTGRSRELAKQKGTGQLYLDFVKELCSFLVQKGKTPMFWGDIICRFPNAARELPKGTVCLNWGYERDQSEENVARMARAGAVQYTCPGVSGWDQLINRTDIAYENIRRMCLYAAKYGAEGVLTTDWGDCGHVNHPDFGVIGMIYGAAFSWNQDIPEYDEINKQISRLEFMDSSELFVSLAAGLSGLWVFQWRDAVNYMEGRKGAFAPEELAGTRASLQRLKQISDRLQRAAVSLSLENRGRIRPYLAAIRGMELIQKLGIVLSAREYRTAMLIPVDAVRLAGELEEWFYYYKEIWRSVSRESELYRLQNVINWYADLLRG